MARRLALAVSAVMLRTDRTRMRPLWSAAHRVLVAVVTRVLVPRPSAGTVYLRGAFAYGVPRFGLSDVDLVCVVADSPGRSRANGDRVRRRWDRLSRRAPALADLIGVAIYEESELLDAVAGSALQTGLRDAASQAPAADVLFAPASRVDDLWLRVRPGLHGPSREWRRVHGPERRPAARPPAGDRHLRAWLELQYWWRYASKDLAATTRHTGPMCVKLVAEPARILLWLVHGETALDRRQALERAARKLPEMADDAAWALAVDDRLHRSPTPPLHDAVRRLARLSNLVAARLAEDARDAGTTEVRLTGADQRPLRGGGADAAGLLPLCDWRAVVLPALLDEAFELRPGDVLADAGDDFAAAAALSDAGPYPTFRAGDLLLLAFSGASWRGMFRAVQSELTDPVSFALARGDDVASFPHLDGWAAVDWADRALIEHRALLRRALADRNARALASYALSGARSAILADTLADGAPVLPVTAAAIVEHIAERDRAVEPAARELLACYVASRAGHTDGAGAMDLDLAERVARAVSAWPAFTLPRRNAVRRVP